MQPGESFLSGFSRWYQMKPLALRTLIAINVVLYVLWQLVLGNISTTALFFYNHLTLHPQLSDIIVQPWQLVTYNFLHLGGGFGGLLHILFNMLWLFWLGRDYEELYGSHRMVGLYLLAGVGGGLMTVLLHALFPGVPNFGGPVYGASACAIGVLCCVATMYPNKGLGLLFLGVIPLKYLAVGFLAIDLLIGIGGNTSLSAHWGGALTGFLVARAQQSGQDVTAWGRVFFAQKRSRSRSRPAAPRREPSGGIFSRLDNWFSTKRGDKDMFGPTPTRTRHSKPEPRRVPTIEENEVDRILDKISEQGYEALTDEEKKTLYEASQK